MPRSLEQNQRLQQYCTWHQCLHPGRKSTCSALLLAAPPNCGEGRKLLQHFPQGAWQLKYLRPTDPAAAGHASILVMPRQLLATELPLMVKGLCPTGVRELSPSAELGFMGASLCLGTQQSCGDSSQIKLGCRGSTQGNTEIGKRHGCREVCSKSDQNLTTAKGLLPGKGSSGSLQVAVTHMGSH